MSARTIHDFSILKQAGITPGMTAKFLKVSRVTASQWQNGHARPHHLLEDRVSEFLKIVRLAVANGTLPIKNFPGRKQLFIEISKAVTTAAGSC